MCIRDSLRKPSPEVEERLTSLERFLDAGIDEFGLQDHFDRWFERDTRPYPVLFVRFEDMATAWPNLRDFVGLPADEPGLRVRPRASEWQSLEEPMRTRIDEMYGPLAVRLETLAPTELR